MGDDSIYVELDEGMTTLERGQLLSDEMYLEAIEKYGDEFVALMASFSQRLDAPLYPGKQIESLKRDFERKRIENNHQNPELHCHVTMPALRNAF